MTEQGGARKILHREYQIKKGQKHKKDEKFEKCNKKRQQNFEKWKKNTGKIIKQKMKNCGNPQSRQIIFLLLQKTAKKN